MACVYILHLASLPEDIRYVGISKNDDATSRLKEHMWNAKIGKPYHVYNWIRKAVEDKNKVMATVVSSGLTWEQAAVEETRLIAEYRAAGLKLTNMTDGGEGSPGVVRSEDYRRRLSASHRGKTFSEEHKVNLAKVWTGRKHSEDTKKRQSETQKGKTLTEEHRMNIAKAARNRRKT
jgi:hypothetical protein